MASFVHKVMTFILLYSYSFILAHPLFIYLCPITIIYYQQYDIMIIDFDKIPEIHLTGFKGGQGALDTRNFSDDKIKIMYSTLRPGASTGLHTHGENSEVIFVISGVATFHYDGVVEECRAGQCHYCPMDHSHYMENLTDHDLVYFAVVPEHH